LGAAVLPNSGDGTELAFLNNYINPDATSMTKLNLDDANFSWDTLVSEGSYVLLKTGNLKLVKDHGLTDEYDTFAFFVEIGDGILIGGGDGIITLGELYAAMGNKLNSVLFGSTTANYINNWKASHFDIVSAPVPTPAAAWLLGSGLVGLVGVRRWRRRG